MDENEQIHEMLVRDIAVEQDRGHGTQHQTVQYTDYENPENNDVFALNQFRVAGLVGVVKLDIVLFVTGIPLGVVEYTRPQSPEPRSEALDQLTRSQNERDGELEGRARMPQQRSESATVTVRAVSVVPGLSAPTGEGQPDQSCGDREQGGVPEKDARDSVGEEDVHADLAQDECRHRRTGPLVPREQDRGRRGRQHEAVDFDQPERPGLGRKHRREVDRPVGRVDQLPQPNAEEHDRDADSGQQVRQIVLREATHGTRPRGRLT